MDYSNLLKVALSVLERVALGCHLRARNEFGLRCWPETSETETVPRFQTRNLYWAVSREWRAALPLVNARRCRQNPRRAIYPEDPLRHRRLAGFLPSSDGPRDPWTPVSQRIRLGLRTCNQLLARPESFCFDSFACLPEVIDTTRPCSIGPENPQDGGFRTDSPNSTAIIDAERAP
jgi:hypothetical protein